MLAVVGSTPIVAALRRVVISADRERSRGGRRNVPGLTATREVRRPTVCKALLPRVAAGEMAAMQECIDTYGPLIWSLGRRFIPDPSEVEDAVQEVFLVLWQNAARFDPQQGAETTFVAMIARRRLIDRSRSQLRGRRRIEMLKQHARESVTPPSDRSSISEEARLARQALGQLSPDQQQVLQLAIHGGYSHQEIAQITDLPLGTVKTHARRGLIHVREALAARETEAQAASEKDS